MNTPARHHWRSGGRNNDADPVVRELENLVAVRDAAPVFIRTDNEPELTAGAIRDWCQTSGTDTSFIQPGSP